jgi:WD40 repeat protein
VPAGATTSDGNGMNPVISQDGRFVAFDSDATDLPGGELNGRIVDVFRKDVTDGSVVLVAEGTADSMTADGSGVVFTSAAPLVAGDANGRADVFVRSVPAAQTFRVSARADGSELAGPSSRGAVSGDGHYVAFASRAPDVVGTSGRSARARIYRKDLVTGAVDIATLGIDLSPRSLIAKPYGVQLRRKVRLIAGTTGDNGVVQRVEVALSRPIGGGRCLWLARGRSFVRAKCSEARWLRARLTGGLRFTARIGRLLPRGTWTVRSRATDGGNRAEVPEAGRSIVTFRVK